MRKQVAIALSLLLIAGLVNLFIPLPRQIGNGGASGGGRTPTPNPARPVGGPTLAAGKADNDLDLNLDSITDAINDETLVSESLYENPHKIESIPPPLEPVVIRRDLASIKPGDTFTSRGIVLVERASGHKSAHFWETEKTIKEVDAHNESLRFDSITKKIIGIGEPYIREIDFTTRESGTENSKGMHSGLETSANIIGSTASWSMVSNEVLRLPESPVTKGTTYRIEHGGTDQDLSGARQADAPLLEGQVVDFVRFDGRDSALIQAKETGTRMIIDINAEHGPGRIESIANQEAQFYVDIQTGEILWSRVQMELIKSDLKRGPGTKITEIAESIK